MSTSSDKQEKPVEQILADALDAAREAGHDVRLVYNNPPGTISFQGSIKIGDRHSGQN